MRASHEHAPDQHGGHGGMASGPSSPGKRTLTEQLGGGEALPDAQRTKFERSLGRDLSAVRVHTSDAAAAEAEQVDARAFASGQDIVFAKGEYDPGNKQSVQLLAHEVAHTAQQQGAAPVGALATTQPGDPAERNADAAAAAMVAGRPAAVSAQPMSIARKTQDESPGDAPGASEPPPEAAGDAGAPGASATGDGAGAPGAAAEGNEGEEEIGELTAERVGQEPDEGEDVGPDVPVRDTEAGKQEIAAAGQQLPPQGGAEELAGGVAPEAGEVSAGAGGGGGGGGEGEGGEVSAEITAAVTEAQSDAREAIAQSEAESAAYKAEMAAQRDRFEAEQNATVIEQLKTMSSIEKRQTLQEMGYDPKKVKKLRDAELDGIIEGKVAAEQRKTKILGMTPEELAGLSPGQKIQFLVDLGIDRKDLDKAGEGKATRLFDDIMKVAHVPGQHKVKIKIKGGLLGKSWVVTVKCDAEGNTELQAEKKGGFLSRLWGWVKAALPIILTVLAPLTAGASLIVLGVYQAAMAIKNGDWLGAVIGAVTAIGGLSTLVTVAKGASAAATTLSKVADVARKVQKVAQTAQAAMAAAKAKNAGSLLGALAQGAAAFAAFSGNAADKFAKTMTRWSERLKKWSAIITGGEKVVQGIKKGDPLAAIGGAFDTAVAVVGSRTATGKALERASKITGFVGAGKRALEARPPNYAAVAEAALGIAGQLKEDRRIEDASRIIARADRLKQAWDKRESDPAALVDAALGLAEAIELARYDLENKDRKDADGKPLPDAERTAITDRYQRAGRIVRSAGAALEAATARPRPNYLGALDAATQLIAELTDNKQTDAAAVVTAKLDAWTRAVNAKDEKAIMQAGIALGEAIDGLRKVIADEHDKARRDAQAQLPAGETLPDEGGAELPPGPSAADVAAADDTSDASQPATTPATNEPAGDPGATQPDDAARDPGTSAPPGASPSGQAPGPAPLPRFDLTITVTPAPAVAPPAPPPAISPEVQQVIDIIKAFAELADDFEHPLAKQLIAEWEQMVKTFEELRKNGMTAGGAYRDVIASLKLLKQTGVFVDAMARELRNLERAFGDPFDAATTRANLQSFGQLKRKLGRLARVGGIPQTFVSAADNLIVVCGYKKDLSGAEASVVERLEAAANLARDVASLPGELAWLGAVARTVANRLGASSAVAAINVVKTAVNRFGDRVGGVVMRWVTPMLEKIAAREGTQAAIRVAERIAVEIAAWGATFEAATTQQLFRRAADLLASKLGVAFRFGVSAPFAIAIEVVRLEAQFADELYRDAYSGVSQFLSARLFGKPIDQLKGEIQNKPSATGAQCDALFRYAFHSMLSAADTEVRGGWLPYAQQEVPRRVGGFYFARAFPSEPVKALQDEPDDVKILIAAPAIKDIACDYLDIQYTRVFGKAP